MQLIIDYVVYIFNNIFEILKKIQLPNSLNYLDYLLGSLILIFIFGIIKGGSTALPSVLNGSISSFKQNKYKKDLAERKRKQQIIETQKNNNTKVATNSKYNRRDRLDVYIYKL